MSPLSPNLDVTNQNSHYFYSKLLALTLAVIFHSGLLPAQSKLRDHDLALNSETPTKSKSETKTSVYFYTEELPFNTSAHEYATGFYDNNLIVVSTRKVNSAKRSLFDQSEYKLLGFTKYQNLWKRPQLLPGIFTGTEDHGGLTFTEDLKRVYYTKASTQHPKSFQLYTAERHSKFSNYWRNPVKALVIDETYSVENPWLAASGKLLFFASNKPGGYGGYDLYVASVRADGSLGNPKNLGPKVNTPGDENFPSLSTDETQFYFASNQSGGYGGFDLYHCFTSQGDYSTPQNLGSTVNTISNEVGLIPVSGSTGFFSSDKDALHQNGLNVYSYQIAD